ncbi:MAG: segregation/condensation protein A [Halobacteria archaeon]
MTAKAEPPKPTNDTADRPVDVLVNMAQEGEIDPWDIDIVEVTDKFLDRIDERDLGRSGRAIMYASMLLRMKSDYLVEEDEEEDEESEEPEMMMGWNTELGDGEGEAVDDPIDKLESEFDRRMKRKKLRNRSKPETLDELIRELRDREKGRWWKESREYDTSESEDEFSGISPQFAGPRDRELTTDDAISTAHEGDIEERVEDVEELVEEEFRHRQELLFAELVEDDSRHDFVTTYISLLFLASRGVLTLEQNEFYGDLWIQKAS